MSEHGLPVSRMDQCNGWNSDPDHQRVAGQARARQFSHEHQVEAGHHAFSAYSARWRAGQGLPPLSVEAVVRYVTIEDIRGPLGQELPAVVRAEIYQAWCDGHRVSVAAWLERASTREEQLP